MCRRVAILKEGRIAALDSTETLLSRFEGRVLRCRLEGGELPAPLAERVLRRHGDDVVLRAGDAEDVRQLLGALHDAGLRAENLTLGQPDLEDVFLAVTAGAK